MNSEQLTVDLGHISAALHKEDDGIWYAANRSLISYPESGNDACLAVEEGSFWFQHRNCCILEVMRQFPPDGSMFDVGGGNGYVALAIQRSGTDVVLVEPGGNGARNAQRRGVRSIVCATLEDARFNAASLPAVGMFDVLEHIADDIVALRQLSTLLIPGGRIYLTVPSYQLLWSEEDVSAGHYRRYSLSELCRRLGSSGFEVEYATYFFALLPLPIFLLRSLPSRLGLRRSASESRAQREHSASGGIAGRVLQSIHQLELQAIANGLRIPAGASCIVVAKTATMDSTLFGDR